MERKNDYIEYAGDYPHKIKCSKCSRKFWTIHHQYTTGVCKECDPSWGDEVEEEWVNKVFEQNKKMFFVVADGITKVNKCPKCGYEY